MYIISFNFEVLLIIRALIEELFDESTGVLRLPLFNGNPGGMSESKQRAQLLLFR